MQPSARPVLKSLHLSVDESTALKNATREWLEQEYSKDVARITMIKRKKLKNQSWRFLQKYGSAFFSKAGNGRLLWSADRQKLVKKITIIMVCQVEYKRRLERRGHEADTIFAVSTGFENDSDSVSRSSESCASEDYDYEPKDPHPKYHQSKFYYTRQNAQPGMPMRQTIEENQSCHNNQSSIDCHKRARAPSTDSSDWDMSIASDVSNLPENVPPRTMAMPGLEFSNEGVQRDGSTQGRICPSNTTFANELVVERRLIDQPTTANFQAQNLSESASKIDVGSDLVNAPGITSYTEASRTHEIASITQSCQQTPPGSVRLPTRVRRLSWIENAHDDSDSKPQPDAPIKTLIDLTLQTSNTVYLGADHFEIIQEDLGVPIVQILLDFLNDKSRQCQKLARQQNGGAIQKEVAEQKAIFMCKMLSELRNDKRIWSGTYVAETS